MMVKTEEEINYIIAFDKSKFVLPNGTQNPEAADNKSKLILYIKKTQTSALKLLADTANQKQNQINLK